MTKIRIERSTEGFIRVQSPYNPEFLSKAHKLNGRWSSPYWVFDERDEQRVRDVLVDVYGTDGAPISTVTCHVTFPKAIYTDSLFLLGREVTRRPSRDAAVRLGQGVIILKGAFYASGGSTKHPIIGGSIEVVLEVRDVPEALANKELLASSAGATGGLIIQIVNKTIAREDELLAEKAKLLARIAEIDAALVAVPSEGANG
jgi:hypothetical protein